MRNARQRRRVLMGGAGYVLSCALQWLCVSASKKGH